MDIFNGILLVLSGISFLGVAALLVLQLRKKDDGTKQSVEKLSERLDAVQKTTAEIGRAHV